MSRNPLGSPDIVGFDTGAATGALIVILVWHGSMTQIAGASVVGGVGTATVVYLLAIKRGVHGYRLILVGIGIAAMLTSVNDYLITRANINDAQSAAVWLTGSLDGRGWDQVRTMTVAVVLLLPLGILLARGLRQLELGDDTARALGTDAERIRLGSVVVGVGLTAVATASAGPIGFIALSAPQVAKRLTNVPGPNVVPCCCRRATWRSSGCSRLRSSRSAWPPAPSAGSTSPGCSRRSGGRDEDDHHSNRDQEELVVALAATTSS